MNDLLYSARLFHAPSSASLDPKWITPLFSGSKGHLPQNIDAQQGLQIGRSAPHLDIGTLQQIIAVPSHLNTAGPSDYIHYVRCIYRTSISTRFNGPRSSELLVQIQLEQGQNHGRPCEYLDADALTLSLRASVVISLVFDFSLGPSFKCPTPGLL